MENFTTSLQCGDFISVSTAPWRQGLYACGVERANQLGGNDKILKSMVYFQGSFR